MKRCHHTVKYLNKRTHDVENSDETDHLTYVADVELSYGPLRKNRLWQHLDDQVSIVQRILIEGPVVVTLHLDTEEEEEYSNMDVTSEQLHLENVKITFTLQTTKLNFETKLWHLGMFVLFSVALTCTLLINPSQVSVFTQATDNVVYTHSAFLHTLSDHHNVVDVLLPNHLPEIIFSSRQRTLRGDILPTEVITLKNTPEEH